MRFVPYWVYAGQPFGSTQKEDKIKCGFRRENGRRFFIGREVKRFMNAQM